METNNEIIGCTKSGKPIYALFINEGHKDFDHQEHKDAAILHNEEAKKFTKWNEQKEKWLHLDQAIKHTQAKPLGWHFDTID